MRWSIEQGKKKGRQPTADQRRILAREPPLDEGGLILARAYAELSTCRPYSATPAGLIPHAIPWTAMADWCAWHGLDGELAAHAMAVIAQIDRVMTKRAIDRLKVKR